MEEANSKIDDSIKFSIVNSIMLPGAYAPQDILSKTDIEKIDTLKLNVEFISEKEYKIFYNRISYT